VLAIVMGLIAPLQGGVWLQLLESELMLMLFLVFLKTDVLKILDRIKNIRLMSYLMVVFLMVIPIAFYVPIAQVNTDYAILALLLVAMPPGTSSPALTDITGGNTELCLGISILAAVVAPFSIPFLFGFFLGKTTVLQPMDIFFDTAAIIFIPMIAAQIFRVLTPRFISKTAPTYTALNILILFLIVYSIISSQQKALLASSYSIILDILVVYCIFIALHIVTYIIAFRHKKEDRIAMVISKTYMNNGLSMVLAVKYFDPSIVLLVTLSELPWNTLLIPYQWILRRQN
ncbi:MAG: bile acid:sodium symporter, partial [Bacteroidota bacterium]